MKFSFQSVAAVALCAFSSLSANASVVTYGTITHDYGSLNGVNASNTFQSCDVLNATSITVRNTANCARFLDSFDFSSMPHGPITNLSLTLNFADTGSTLESWAMRPASSGLTGSSKTQNLTKTANSVSQTFVINSASNPDVFNSIVSNGSFSLWFTHNGFGQQNFTLNSATLDVNGESVPEPASVALFSIAALAISAARRRAGKRAAA